MYRLYRKINSHVCQQMFMSVLVLEYSLAINILKGIQYHYLCICFFKYNATIVYIALKFWRHRRKIIYKINNISRH